VELLIWTVPALVKAPPLTVSLWPCRGGYEPDTQELYTDPLFQKGLSEIGRRLDAASRHDASQAKAH
jgi:hypothetical protein